MHLSYKYRIYPDLTQEQILLNWLEQCRRVYNYALAERKDWSNSRQCAVNACSICTEYIMVADAPYPNYYIQKRNLTQAKNKIPELKAVHSQVLQNVLARFDKLFNFMQDRGFGFPSFKKAGQYHSFIFPQFQDNPIIGNQIKLPKIGTIRINLHRPIPNQFTVKQIRIVRKISGWYAILVLQTNLSIPDILPAGNSMGIDQGREIFLAASIGKLVEYPQRLIDLQTKLSWLQRQLIGKESGSCNYQKQQQKIAKLNEHIHNLRREFHFQLAHQLCDGVGMIFAQDVKTKLIQHDSDWGQFLEILRWVCCKRGVFFLKIDPKYSNSQTCPHCGASTRKKQLNQTVYHCRECGYTTNRDIANAQIVEQRGLTAVGYTVKLPVEVSASVLR